MITDLRTLGGPESEAVAVNEQGWVVGYADTALRTRHAVLWQSGKMIDFGTLGGSSSEASAVNEQGWVVGSAGTKSGARHAFLWRKGTMIDLGTLGGPRSYAAMINESGQVLGEADTKRTVEGEDKALGEVRVHLRHAFVWRSGNMVDLGTRRGCSMSHPISISDSGVALAVCDNDPYDYPTRSFTWQDGVVTDLGAFDAEHTSLTDMHTAASDMNEHGQVVGESDTQNATRAFLWEDGVLTDLGSLAGKHTLWASSWATVINERGQIIGSSDTERDPVKKSSERR